MTKLESVAASVSGQYEDPEFPARDESLGNQVLDDMKGKQLAWQRPQEFCRNPRLYEGGISCGDVIQGVLGDCWFLGGLSVIATRPGLLEKVIQTGDYASKGLFGFYFYKFGEWHEVVIDDLVPVSSHGPCFATSQDENEMWIVMIEKAYAKLHGCYSALIGGFVSDALVDITGGIPSTILFDDYKGELESGAFWTRLYRQFQSQQYLMGCARSTAGTREVDTEGSGILQGHAYGILDMVEIQGYRLLKVRNPWGCKEWTGDWSDSSPLWTPDLKRALKLENKDDGIFWICYEDFIVQFNKIYMCRLPDRHWNTVSFRGRWAGEFAGGCVNNKTWINNPQYSLHMKQDGTMNIVLQKKDPRAHPETEDLCIGFIVFDSATGKRVVRYKKPVLQSEITNTREVCAELSLPAGRYVIVPHTFDQGEESDYHLDFHSAVDYSVVSLDGQRPFKGTAPLPTSPSAVDVFDGVDDSGDDNVPAVNQKIYEKDDVGVVAATILNLMGKIRAHYPKLDLPEDDKVIATINKAKEGASRLFGKMKGFGKH